MVVISHVSNSDCYIAFTAGNNKYKADFTLPSTEPSDTAPIVFNIESCPANAEGEDYQSVATVAVGGKEGDETHFYANVAPPTSLLPESVSSIVQEVGISVACGHYDPDKQQFTSDEPAQDALPAPESNDPAVEHKA